MKKYTNKIFCFMLSIIIIIPFSVKISVSDQSYQFEIDVVIGSETTNIEHICDDTTLKFINCEEIQNYYPSGIYKDYKGTVLIMDAGLSIDQWKQIEYPYFDGVYADIIAYKTISKSVIGDYGQDSLIGIDSSSDLGYNDDFDQGNWHGPAVISAFTSIAKGARIGYVNIDVGDNTGYPINDKLLWDWVKNNINNYDISSISISSSFDLSVSSSVYQTITDIYNRGVFITTSIGNEGYYRGDRFPQYHEYVFSVGSIDHENRGAYMLDQYGRIYWDDDYKSKKHYFTGSSQAAIDNPERCHTKTEVPFCSSFGYNQEDHALAMDFVMPGNGVPVPGENVLGTSPRTFVYTFGTSFSTPYLAAAAIIAVYGYNMGFYIDNGWYKDQSTQTIISLLKSSSLNSIETGWHYRYGWGYIDLGELHNNAYQRGLNEYNDPYCKTICLD